MWREAVETLVLLLAPSAPYAAEELWEQLGNEYSVHTAPWPTWDDALLVQSTVEIVVQVNDKMRDRITLAADASEDEAKRAALASERVAQLLNGSEPRRVIYVPKKLVNIVQ
jgi:leucyl-tRNA synthetase